MANKDLLYSRQIAEIGEKTMGQLSQLHILIIGQKSVGFECSKCLALMGIGNIYLYDYEETKITIGESDIKTTNKEIFGLNFGLNAILNTLTESRKYTISELTAKYLRTLNPYIQVNNSIINQSLNSYLEKIENKIDLVIITDFYKIRLNDFYEKMVNKKIKVILGFTLGYYGLVHTNFINHTVFDINGEPKRSSYLSNINYDGKILKGQLEKNNLFSIGEKLNIGIVRDCCLDKIEIETPEKIELESIYLEEIKEQYKPNFQNWKEINNDISKWNIISIGENNYPLEKVLEFINNPTSKSNKKDLYFEDCTRFFELYPIGSIIGGIIAHEAIKITGKYLPIEQSLIIDASVLLPKNLIKEKSGIYGNIESLISNEILTKLKSSRIFMIGAGALGCEHAKNLVMMGGATSKVGQFTITDPDTISLSNLSRQFLFQSENIGELKSKVIESKLANYFPKTKIKSFDYSVGKESYKSNNQYDFWRTQDILLGALDNHEARLFIDKMAVKFEKPLFESGTQGTKCHTQTIIPFKTITYGEIEDPPQENIPMCTIKNFPNNFTHCIEWALEAFYGIFTQTIGDIIEIKNNKTKWIEQIKTQNTNMIYDRISKVNLFLNHFNKPLEEMISGIIEDIYNEYYIEPINILLNSFPVDLEENGERFWGGKRKRPNIIDLESSIDFKKSILGGLVKVFNLNLIDSKIIENCGKTKINKTNDIKYSLEELEKNKVKEINKEIVEKLMEDIELFNDEKLKDIKISILEFDKDCNFTLEILNSLAIQRAKSYTITIGNLNETRKIAGRIIPALSTTTTIVSGFVMLELLKYLNESKAYDFNINIAINQFIGFETMEAPLKYSGMFDKAYNQEVIVYPDNITRWHKLKVSMFNDGVDDIFSLVEHLKSELDDIPIEMLTIDNNILYTSDMKKSLPIKLNNKILKPKDSSEWLLKNLWAKYEVEYNDCILINIYALSPEGIPIITKPIYLYR